MKFIEVTEPARVPLRSLDEETLLGLIADHPGCRPPDPHLSSSYINSRSIRKLRLRGKISTKNKKNARMSFALFVSVLCFLWLLIATKGHHRIDPSRSSSRNIARDDRHHNQSHRRQRDAHRIQWRQSVEETGHQPSHRECSAEANYHPD